MVIFRQSLAIWAPEPLFSSRNVKIWSIFAPQAENFEEFETLNPYFTAKINEYCSKTMIFWVAEGGTEPKIAKILDLGSEISYEGEVFLQRGGIFVKLSTDLHIPRLYLLSYARV